MRVPILLVGLALIFLGVHAETLSSADREALLESLSKLRESAETKVDAKFRVALTAYRTAMSSDDAAIELYLNCMERVNFDELPTEAWNAASADLDLRSTTELVALMTSEKRIPFSAASSSSSHGKPDTRPPNGSAAARSSMTTAKSPTLPRLPLSHHNWFSKEKTFKSPLQYARRTQTVPTAM